MSLHQLYGHGSLMSRLEGAVASNRFPQAVLLTGPEGVGKQRIALRLAELLLTRAEGTAPAEEDRAAGQVRDLAHPDLHWFVPLVITKKASDPKKQIEDVEDALAELMTERRKNHLYGRPEGQASHSVASARLIQRRARLTPFQSRRKLFIIGDAERLVVQESSPEAANTLLKVLEEPPADTTLILTSSAPDALLPTIRSRLVTVRVAPLTPEDIESFLIAETGASPKKARSASIAADGSIGRAMGISDAGNDADRAAERFLEAVSKGPTAWAGVALRQQPWGARGAFTAMLDTLAVRLRADLEKGLAGPQDRLRRRLKALELVQEHRRAAQGNVNPQLATAVLAFEMSEVL